MRSNFLRFAAISFLLLCFSQSLSAQYSRMVVNPIDAKRLGMEVMWRTQVDMSPTSKLQSITQVFGKSKKLVKYVVSYDDVVEEFFEDDVDRFGRKIGVAGAKDRADAKLKRYQSIGFASAKVERVVEDPDVLSKLHDDVLAKYKSATGFEKGKLENELRGIAARRKRLLPEITFLAQSNTSLVQSIDGRTGKTNWRQQIGLRNHPCMNVIAKREHFAVVNASTVYCGLIENGRVVWERECRGAPGSGSAMTQDNIFVPMVNGFVEQFLIRDGNAPTGDIVSIGHSLLGATSSDQVVAWPSDRGELNVAFDNINLNSVSYRLVPKRKIVSNAFFLEPYLFATSTDGSLYCLEQTSGKLVWEIPTGISISQSPFAVNQHVYFINDQHVLNQATIDGGIPTWSKSGISKVICVSSKRIYCLNQQQHLIALDLKTGNYVGALTAVPVDYVYQNSMSDRLLVSTSDGLIQCLREVDQIDPIFYQKPEIGKVNSGAPSLTPGQTPAQNPGQQKPANNDPFGGGGGNDDPFGGGGAKKADDDPFGGGGGDPFGGGGAKKADDDPFGGGGSDPFGGGGGNKANDDPFGN